MEPRSLWHSHARALPSTQQTRRDFTMPTNENSCQRCQRREQTNKDQEKRSLTTLDISWQTTIIPKPELREFAGGFPYNHHNLGWPTGSNRSLEFAQIYRELTCNLPLDASVEVLSFSQQFVWYFGWWPIGSMGLVYLPTFTFKKISQM